MALQIVAKIFHDKCFWYTLSVSLSAASPQWHVHSAPGASILLNLLLQTVRFFCSEGEKIETRLRGRIVRDLIILFWSHLRRCKSIQGRVEWKWWESESYTYGTAVFILSCFLYDGKIIASHHIVWHCIPHSGSIPQQEHPLNYLISPTFLSFCITLSIPEALPTLRLSTALFTTHNTTRKKRKQ